MIRRRHVALPLLLVLALFAARPAAAQESSRHRASHRWFGEGNSIRPFVGFTSDLAVGSITPFSGSIFLFGADYAMADHSGFTIIPGLRLGVAPYAFFFTPDIDVAWRFKIGKAPSLVPYLGVGVALRMGSQRYGVIGPGYYGSFFMALEFRFIAGLDVWLPAGFGFGAKLVVPEIGPMLTPYVTPLGAIELTFGPRFRF
jgi:hypothetical protein